MAEVKNDKKTCFIITPIGSESDPIRRHIDGIIDAVISPVLEEHEYELIVAHRIDLTGSINKQVITGIYNSDLIIANLTGLNPNVMYELAFAHSIGKPTITIAEDGNVKLPFDIATERTIFYKNDFKGGLELKDRLVSVLDCISNKEEGLQVDNPIYTWLSNSVYESTLAKKIESQDVGNDIKERDLFEYIVNRLDSMESKINMSNNARKESNIIINESNVRRIINTIEFRRRINTKYLSEFESTLIEGLKEFDNIIRLQTINFSPEQNICTMKFRYKEISELYAKEIIEKIINNASNKLNEINHLNTESAITI